MYIVSLIFLGWVICVILLISLIIRDLNKYLIDNEKNDILKED